MSDALSAVWRFISEHYIIVLIVVVVVWAFISDARDPNDRRPDL